MIDYFNETSIFITIGLPLSLVFLIIYFSQEDKIKSKFPIFGPIVLGVSFVLILLCAWFFKESFTDKSLSLLASLIVGLLTLLISIFINYTQLNSIDQFKTLKIISILRSRSDRNYYYPIIDRADQNLWVLGVTASRLLNDFLEPASKEENKKILIRKIEKGLTIKLLLPKKNKKNLPKGEHYKNHDITIDKLKNLDIEIKNNIEVRLYNSVPAHSIFYTEKECIVGPIFPNVDSKNTPAIHLEVSSLYAEEYLKYFHVEWDKATIVDIF